MDGTLQLITSFWKLPFRKETYPEHPLGGFYTSWPLVLVILMSSHHDLSHKGSN